jgi:hypothetical protein
VLRNRLHEKRGDAVAELPDPFVELPCESKLIREGPEPLELRKRKPPALVPVHGAVQAEAPIVAPDSPSPLSRVELLKPRLVM